MRRVAQVYNQLHKSGCGIAPTFAAAPHFVAIIHDARSVIFCLLAYCESAETDENTNFCTRGLRLTLMI